MVASEIIMIASAFALLVLAQTDWPVYGHDPGGQRYSPLSQINTTNVTKLERAWTFHTGEQVYNADYKDQKIAAFEATSVVVGNTLYFSTPGDSAIALDATTGKQIWRYDAQLLGKGRKFHSSRGVSVSDGRVYFGTQDGRMIALDSHTGKPVPGFGKEGTLDLRRGVAEGFEHSQYSITSPPALFQGLLITGAAVPEAAGPGPSGDVRAFDRKSGELRWRFHTWTGGGSENRTGANIWSTMTVDTEHGIVFLPVGSATYDFYGADRPGNNLYANSLVALDARTGRKLWHRQLVHHDLWDYDLPAPPALITVRGMPAVAQVTKMGFVYFFDRFTGQPFFPIEEVDVPKSHVPGEQSWPTQPMPTLPAPLTRGSITAADLSTVTPQSQRACAELFQQLKTGPRFTPWGTEMTLVFPGTLGGGTWSGGSFDPARGLFFVNANDIGAIGKIVNGKRTSPQGDYARFWDIHHLPCQQPPWGTLTAIDVNSGRVAWKSVLGITEGIAQKTGAPNIGGSIATAGGLVFIGATNDARFRAFDAARGTELWTTTLEASGHATPVTYQGANGRQYVVIAAGGGGFFSAQGADVLAAYALPATAPDTTAKPPRP